jgi:hypothetical protein
MAPNRNRAASILLNAFSRDRHGDRSRAAAAERQKFSRLLKLLRAGWCSGPPGRQAGALPVLVAFGDYDVMRLRGKFEDGGALVDGWKLFGAASLLSEAAE